MIRRRTSAGIVVLLALVALSYWLGRLRTDGPQRPIEGLNTQLDYALYDFELQVFDLDGQPSTRLIAPVLANQAATGIGKITQPEFHVTNRGNVWQIVAQSATVAPDRERVTLHGEVSLQRRLAAPGPAMDVYTSELLLELTRRVASTDRPVRIQDGSDTLRAVGFEFDLATNHFTLLEDVQLSYAVN
jgi:LPS export ABC transporter protein LptC